MDNYAPDLAGVDVAVKRMLRRWWLRTGSWFIAPALLLLAYDIADMADTSALTAPIANLDKNVHYFIETLTLWILPICGVVWLLVALRIRDFFRELVQSMPALDSTFAPQAALRLQLLAGWPLLLIVTTAYFAANFSPYIQFSAAMLYSINKLLSWIAVCFFLLTLCGPHSRFAWPELSLLSIYGFGMLGIADYNAVVLRHLLPAIGIPNSLGPAPDFSALTQTLFNLAAMAGLAACIYSSARGLRFGPLLSRVLLGSLLVVEIAVRRVLPEGASPMLNLISLGESSVSAAILFPLFATRLQTWTEPGMLVLGLPFQLQLKATDIWIWLSYLLLLLWTVAPLLLYFACINRVPSEVQ